MQIWHNPEGGVKLLTLGVKTVVMEKHAKMSCLKLNDRVLEEGRYASYIRTSVNGIKLYRYSNYIYSTSLLT
jgi:hypothetical protein